MSTSSPASRRDFLKHSTRLVAAGALAGVALPHVHAAGSDQVSIALIGCGGRGGGAASNALSQSGPPKLVAMADVFQHRLDGAFNSLKGKYKDQVDVPDNRKFIGFDAYQGAIDSLKKGDVAIFFGLSGTGKTTLSADPSRTLIGDDEHGWAEDSLFNFEGGCYAKVIKLSREAEPEIYATTERFGTVLENVVHDPHTRSLDLDDGTHTENTRACYPIDFIPNTLASGIAGTPENIVMLTADAFGVLPPISRLSPEQAMYHFLSGYTARVAGTEKGVTEPQATFSTCFGAPFMPRHPTVYAKMLGEKMARQNVKCWLVNTGWSGGAAGVGERMAIRHTRAMVRAALDGTLVSVAASPDPNFGMLVPNACPDVPGDVLNPRNTWKDKKAYDSMARDLTQRFEKNFQQFEGHVDSKVKQAAIRAAA